MNIDFDNIKNKFEEKANAIYYDNDKLKRLLSSVKETAQGNKQIAEIWDDLKSMMGLLIDWVRGDYKNLSKSSAIMIIISFLYLINPLDIIPDFLFGGYIDDIAVIGFVFKKLSEEIKIYKEWKSAHSEGKAVYDSEDFIEINLDQDEDVVQGEYDIYDN